MTHYRMLDRAPSVVITSNQNELKVYQGNLVYLNNGDNFELRFFNPLPEKIGVEINFNGMKKGDGYLVLNPGQDLTLDRFLDEQRKMIFETYVIDGNNEAAVKAIQENGVISFNFYKESYRGNYSNNENVNINYNFPPKPYNYNNKVYHNTYNNNYYGHVGTSGYSGTGGISGSSGLAGVCGASGVPGSGLPHFTNTSTTTFSTTNLNSRIYTTPGIFTTETDNSFVCGSGDIDYSQYVAEGTGNLSFSKDYWFPTSTGAPVNLNPLETGRIEKGDISGQKLKSVNAQFAERPFYSVTYKLMPVSAMNKGINEVRFYCAHCGYRIRKNTWEFCPKCGSHLD